jgi:hypothetical protein
VISKNFDSTPGEASSEQGLHSIAVKHSGTAVKHTVGMAKKESGE